MVLSMNENTSKLLYIDIPVWILGLQDFCGVNLRVM